MSSEPEFIVNQLQLASILDADRNSIAAYTRAGLPVAKRGHGRRGHQYNLAAAIRWVRQRDREAHERALAAAKSASPTQAARARKWVADARRSEIRASREAGEVVLVKAVEQTWSRMVVEARTALLALPSKAKGKLPHLSSADLSTIDALIRQALEGLAGADEAAKS